MTLVIQLSKVALDATKNNQQKGVKWAKDYEIKRAGGRIRTDGNALRKHCSTAELHRLSHCYKHSGNTLVMYLTLAIITFACSPCQAFLHHSQGFPILGRG